jgi:hypothetical protein
MRTRFVLASTLLLVACASTPPNVMVAVERHTVTDAGEAPSGTKPDVSSTSDSLPQFLKPLRIYWFFGDR